MAAAAGLLAVGAVAVRGWGLDYAGASPAATPPLPAPEAPASELAPLLALSRDRVMETMRYKVGRADRDTFLSAMAEVEHGKLAMGKATNANVKAFGEQMIADHTKAGAELKILAVSKSLTVPALLDPTHQAIHDNLAKLSGAAFDRAELDALLALAEKGCADLTRLQHEALAR